MTEENDNLIILEDGASQEKSIKNGNTVNEHVKNNVDISAFTEWVNDDVPPKQNVHSTEKKMDPSSEATAIWTPCDEEQAPGEDDDVVIIDECGEGDEFLESTTNAPVEITESEKPSEGKNLATLVRKKKRLLKRKVVRFPKEVFDYMGRIEEDGTVRLNLTQFSLFYLNEISKTFSSAPAEVWDTTDVPLMDVSVPPTAKENPFLIVDNFSNEPVARAAQEKRLQAILKNRQKLAEKQKQREADIIAGKEILPAEGSHRGATGNKNKRPMESEERNGKKAGEEQSPNKKRSAPSSTPESGSAAKQPRLEEKNSIQTKSVKTFPKKAVPTPGKTGSQNATNSTAIGSSSKPKARRGSYRNRRSRKRSPPYPGLGTSPFVSPRIEHREWQSSPAPFLDQRHPRDTVYGGQMHYGEPYPFDDRRVGGDMSSWARPCTQPNEMYKLESMMRRTVPESVSPLDAIRQVEKMGLTSVVGALLSAVDSSRNLGCASHQNPSRAIPSMLDDPHTRIHPLPSDLDYSRSSTRDISKYVEPLEEFIDSSRMRSTMGGGMASGVGGSGISSYGQSYPAFAAQSFGGMLDYERDRSRSPLRRSYR